MVQLPCPDAQQAVMTLSQQLHLASSSFEQNPANGSTGATEGGKCYVAIKVSHCTSTSQDATHRATHLIQGSTTDRLSPQGKVYDVTGNKAYLPGASYNGKYILSLPRWHARYLTSFSSLCRQGCLESSGQVLDKARGRTSRVEGLG